MAVESLNWFQISTPKLQSFIVRTGYYHSRAFDVCYLSDDIIVSRLNAFDFVACSPVPEIKRLILRATNNVVASFVIKDSYCMFMVGIFTHFFLCGEVPNNGLAIPRTSYYVGAVHEVHRRDSTVMH